MIDIKNNVYSLHTDNTTYSFRILNTGHLEHLYYGRRISQMDPEACGNSKAVLLTGEADLKSVPEVSLEDICLEMSSYGKGDIHDPFVEITYADGNFTNDFRFVSSEVSKGKKPFDTLPGSLANEMTETLTVRLEDVNYGVALILSYYVFPENDVITRSAKLINNGSEACTVEKLMSTEVDLPGCGYTVSSFHGNWAREMDRHDTKVTAGQFVMSSYTGNTSSRTNPFFMVSRGSASETAGEVYAFNLVYSGNHYESVEADSHDHTRVTAGINPRNFEWKLMPGEKFESPESVMTFSASGYETISHNMHDFVREHIIRGEWQHKERPLLLNSWEAAYFDINEEKLLEMAKSAKEAGIELFVMDDGWFGERNDDTTSLGDWDVNLKKLPGGLGSLADKINALGLDFGIWIEPEMISVKSRLYEAHPDWDMSVPGRPHVEQRTQRILDLANPEVVDYIADKIISTLESANISYVKWDMNRNMTDVFSKYLPADRQKETTHRYVMGFYRMAEKIMGHFPDILFEGCASGGNRFDLGMLCYFPQIWASDDTDALRRISIQNGYSYGYPTVAPTTHVSAVVNHQTHRRMPLATRFNVALLGNLGYEVNLTKMNRGELCQIKYQTDFYKKYRKYLQYGDFYRSNTRNMCQWTTVSKDRDYAFVVLTQILAEPNPYPVSFKVPGLEPGAMYRVKSEPEFYDLLDLDDVLRDKVSDDHEIYKVTEEAVPITDVEEYFEMTGEALMNGGILLRRTMGVRTDTWNDPVDYFSDFASRLYVIQKLK